MRTFQKSNITFWQSEQYFAGELYSPQRLSVHHRSGQSSRRYLLRIIHIIIQQLWWYLWRIQQPDLQGPVWWNYRTQHTLSVRKSGFCRMVWEWHIAVNSGGIHIHPIWHSGQGTAYNGQVCDENYDGALADIQYQCRITSRFHLFRKYWRPQFGIRFCS